MAEQLRDDFNLPGGAAPNLRRAYSAANRRRSGDDESLPQYLQRRFTNTTPPTWMSNLARFPWAQIWTLNIDDCVERSYAAYRSVTRQKILSISWTERHRTPRHGMDELLLIHLHGKASRSFRDDELIFDISSYLQASNQAHRWHALFGDYFPFEPFLVLGAGLDEELDLQAVLEQGRFAVSAAHDSFIINRTISELQAEEYRSYGLIPISATSAEFFEAVHTRPLRPLPSGAGEGVFTAPDPPPFAASAVYLGTDMSPDDGYDVGVRRHGPR